MSGEAEPFESVLEGLPPKKRLERLDDEIKKSNDNDRTLKAAKLYLAIAEEIKSPREIARGNLHLGSSFWLRDDYPNSLKFLFRARQKAFESRDTATHVTADTT